MASNPMVLQHVVNDTIHTLRKDGRTLCGRGGESFKKRRLTSANKRPNAHFCGKCGHAVET